MLGDGGSMDLMEVRSGLMASMSRTRIATGTMTGVANSFTIQHNLGTKKVLVFWIAENGSKLNSYTQILCAFVFPEAYENNGYIGPDDGNISIVGKDVNNEIGWVGSYTNSNNVSITSMNSRQFYYGKYDDGNFANDGNSVTIDCMNRNLYSNVTYRWYVIAID